MQRKQKRYLNGQKALHIIENDIKYFEKERDSSSQLKLNELKAKQFILLDLLSKKNKKKKRKEI